MAGRVGGELARCARRARATASTSRDEQALAEQRQLVVELGGKVHDVVGHDTAEGMAAFARQEKATQIVLGASRRSRWHELLHGSFVARLTRLVPEIDVHVIARTTEEVPSSPARSRRREPVRRRTVIAWLLTALALPLLIAVTLPFRETMALSTELLLVLVVVLVIAALGGVIVGTVAAIVASLLVNWFFVEPYSTLTIGDSENVVALAVFVVVAITTGSAGRHRLATFPRGAPRPAGGRGVGPFDDEPHHRSRAGPTPDRADPVGVRARWRPARRGARRNLDDHRDGRRGRGNTDRDAVGTQRQRPRRRAHPRDLREVPVARRPSAPAGTRRPVGLGDREPDARVRSRPRQRALADVDAVRTALLRAVSHDLRTPLASIKAMVSGLRDPSVAWTPEQTAEALLTVDEETDRLNRLVGNLLDASRLQIGALAVDVRPAERRRDRRCCDAQHRCAERVGSRRRPGGSRRRWRAIRRCSNAAWRTSSRTRCGSVRPTPRCGSKRRRWAQRVHLRVIDRGIGIKPLDRTRVTLPFQRFDDTPDGNGVGLGLSIAEGFVDAMGGCADTRRHAGRRSHGDDHVGG